MRINLTNSITQRVRNIRKERLEPFLTSKDARVRQIALDVLDNPSKFDVFRALIVMLGSPIQRGFLYLFSPIKNLLDKKRYKSLLNSLSSKNLIERKVAIQRLAEFPDQETFELVVKLLSDESPDIRLASVETLWKMQIKEAIHPLKESYIEEIGCFNRIMISLCLISMGDTSTFTDLFDDIAENSVQNEHWDMTDLVTSSLSGELGQDSIPFLENGLMHSDWHVRWISLRVIYDLTCSRVDFLKPYSFLSNDPHVELRELFNELFHTAN